MLFYTHDLTNQHSGAESRARAEKQITHNDIDFIGHQQGKHVCLHATLYK